MSTATVTKPTIKKIAKRPSASKPVAPVKRFESPGIAEKEAPSKLPTIWSVTDRNQKRVADLVAKPLRVGAIVNPALLLTGTPLDTLHTQIDRKSIPISEHHQLLFLKSGDAKSPWTEWMVGTTENLCVVVRIYPTGTLKFTNVSQADVEGNYGLGTAFDADRFDFWETEEQYAAWMEASKPKPKRIKKAKAEPKMTEEVAETPAPAKKIRKPRIKKITPPPAPVIEPDEEELLDELDREAQDNDDPDMPDEDTTDDDD